MMPFRAFYVLGIALVVIGCCVAPTSSLENSNKTPAPPKRADQTQEDYARQILKGRDISELNPVLLPKPDVNIHKYILTDDASTVEGFLKHGNFIPKFIETWVWKVEDQTAYRLTVQDHYNNFMYCVQRIRIYEELETPQQMAKRLGTKSDETKQSKAEGASGQRLPESKKKTPRRKFKDNPRDDILAKCEGGFGFRPHTRYRFSFADTIFFYGANRIIFKIQDPNLVKVGSFICHERTYTAVGKSDKVLDEQQCNTKVEKIFAWKGTMRNLIWNLIHQPKKILTGLAFQEK